MSGRDRATTRKKSFKKGIDQEDVLRKRQEYNVELRKNKREEALQKRRNMMSDELSNGTQVGGAIRNVAEEVIICFFFCVCVCVCVCVVHTQTFLPVCFFPLYSTSLFSFSLALFPVSAFVRTPYVYAVPFLYYYRCYF